MMIKTINFNNKKRVISFLAITVLLAVIGVSGLLPASAQQTNFVTIYPNQIDDYIANPGIGWQNVTGNTPYLLPETVAYPTRQDISWQVLNPNAGAYNWSALDNLIQSADSAGKLFSFRVYTMQGESYGGHHVPQWVVNRDSSVIQGGQPNYASCTYQTFWATFVDQLRLRYDGDDRIAFIDISGYGNFNEWSWTDGQTVWEDDFLNPQSTDAMARRRLADMYIGGTQSGHLCENSNGNEQTTSYSYPGFNTTQLVMPYAGIQQSSRYVASRRSDVGIRYDCLGRNESNNSDPMVKIPELFEQTWRNAPIVFEFCAGSTTNSAVMERARVLLNNTHGTIVHDNLEYPRNESNLENLMINVGYRYQLTQAVFESSVLAGDDLNLTMSWQNVGTAPAYPSLGHDFELHIYLLDDNGNVVIDQTSGTNLTWWMPADNLPDTPPTNAVGEVIAIGDVLETGTYDLRVAVINTNTDQAINLAFVGNDGQGRYQIGRVDVVSDTSDVTPAPSATLVPTNTAIPTLVPTNTAIPTLVPTNTTVPTLVPTNTAIPTLVPTNTPVPIQVISTSVSSGGSGSGGGIQVISTSVSVPVQPPSTGGQPVVVASSVPNQPVVVAPVQPNNNGNNNGNNNSNGNNSNNNGNNSQQGTVHVRNLDGQRWVNPNGTWTAFVDIHVVNQDNRQISGVTVTATWSDGTVFTCQTQGDWCGARLENLPTSVETMTLTITSLSHPSYAYNASANSDPQAGRGNRRDSNGTTITVVRPRN